MLINVDYREMCPGKFFPKKPNFYNKKQVFTMSSMEQRRGFKKWLMVMGEIWKG